MATMSGLMVAGLMVVAGIVSWLLCRITPFWPPDRHGFRARWRAPLAVPLLPFLGAFAMIGLAAPFGWILLYAVFGAALCRFDLRHGILPDPLTLGLALCGVGRVIVTAEPAPAMALAGAALGAGLLAAVLLGFRAATGRDGMGWGDVKLMAGIGIWTGAAMVPMLIALAAGAGLIWALAGRRRSIAFGPPLVLAGWMILLLGELDFWSGLI